MRFSISIQTAKSFIDEIVSLPIETSRFLLEMTLFFLCGFLQISRALEMFLALRFRLLQSASARDQMVNHLVFFLRLAS